MRYQGMPEKITIDKSGVNVRIGLRQIKYLNNVVEQDHRAVKRSIQPMLSWLQIVSVSRKHVDQHRKHAHEM
jgi:transposase-like protein